MKNIVALSAVMTGFLIACGSAPANGNASGGTGASNDTSSASDDVTLPASSDTTNAIGVTRWGASVSGDTSTIHGYDENGDVRVTVTHVVNNVSAQQSSVTDSVSGKLGSATLEAQLVAGQADADGNFDFTTTITQNTFQEGDSPSQVLDAALADQNGDGSSWVEASSVTGGSLGGGSGVSLGTKSLHPTDISLSRA